MGNYTQLAVLGRTMAAKRRRPIRAAVDEAPAPEGPSFTCPKCGDVSVAPSWCDRCQLEMADPGRSLAVRGEDGSVTLQRWGGAAAMALGLVICATVLLVWPVPPHGGRALEPLVMAGVAGLSSAFLGLFLVAYLGPRLEAWRRAARERRAFAAAPDATQVAAGRVRGRLHIEGKGEARRVWLETESGPVELDPGRLRARVDLRLDEGDEVEAIGALEPSLRRDGYRGETARALGGETVPVRRRGSRRSR